MIDDTEGGFFLLSCKSINFNSKISFAHSSKPDTWIWKEKLPFSLIGEAHFVPFRISAATPKERCLNILLQQTKLG
jgi:hypothetical protein